MKRARDDVPALFLTGPVAGAHADCDALAALVDGECSSDADERVATHKRSRCAGLGRVQVDLALTALGTSTTVRGAASAEVESESNMDSTMLESVPSLCAVASGAWDSAVDGAQCVPAGMAAGGSKASCGAEDERLSEELPPAADD